jgi:hypothetical protein
LVYCAFQAEPGNLGGCVYGLDNEIFFCSHLEAVIMSCQGLELPVIPNFIPGGPHMASTYWDTHASPWEWKVSISKVMDPASFLPLLLGTE